MRLISILMRELGNSSRTLNFARSVDLEHLLQQLRLAILRLQRKSYSIQSFIAQTRLHFWKKLTHL